MNNTAEVPSKLIALKSTVLNAEESATAAGMLQADLQTRVRTFAERDSAEFAKIQTSAEWEKFRDQRLAALKKSIGALALSPEILQSGAPGGAGFEVTGTIAGDGYRVENLLIAGRPGLPITANLYAPAEAGTAMPGILVVSSHHNPKWQGELQDMGMLWARSGCVVIVIDNLGYGERGQQFYGGREDYRWRYHTGMQLYTAGENLMAWMAADQRRALDVLTSRAGVDPKRIVVMGSVAGGGDIAALLAATDSRVTCAIPFNTGGAGTHPAAAGQTEWVDPIGGGDWDAVRCLRNKGRDGFTNWLIAAANAPRYTIYAREFEWQPAGDEGYARLGRVFGLFGAAEHLTAVHGFGDERIAGKPHSACNNIGPHQRKEIFPVLKNWLSMPLPTEFQHRLSTQQLTCLTPEARTHWRVRPLNELLAEAGAQKLAAARAALAALPADKRKEQLRRIWAEKLGNVTPAVAPELKRSEVVSSDAFAAEKLLLVVEPGISIPSLLLKPKAAAADAKLPVVLAVAQGGKDLFLCKRAQEVSDLLARNVAVCLVDVRGSGETSPGGDRYWYSSAVDTASVELMLGQTILGSKVRDLRSVLAYLRTRADIDAKRVAVWGESFAPVNAPTFVDPPMKTDNSALQAEPLGATAALLLALYEDDVKAVIARGGLTGYASLFDGPACNIVSDMIVPEVLETGDLSTLAATLAPLPLKLEASVDGRNRLARQPRLDRDFTPAREAYKAQPDALTISPEVSDETADWMSKMLLK